MGNDYISRNPDMTTATAPRKLHNATVTCPFCGGSGKLHHFSHIQNGDCFACGASGKLRDLNAFIGDCSDVVLTVWVNNGRFSGAELRRRTWKTVQMSVAPYRGKEWGRDSYYRAIDNVEEAREIWRNAKRLGIITELVD
jgi:hypothetical protein